MTGFEHCSAKMLRSKFPLFEGYFVFLVSWMPKFVLTSNIDVSFGAFSFDRMCVVLEDIAPRNGRDKIG